MSADPADGPMTRTNDLAPVQYRHALHRAIGAALGLAVLAVAPPAPGATFTVDSALDSGPGTLRAAVTAANASGDASNAIRFSLPAATTITLTSPPDTATAPLTIDGSDVPGLAIAGNIFTSISTGADLTLRGVQLDVAQLYLSFGSLVFDEPGNATLSSNIGGLPTSIVKTGSGTVTLTGNASFPTVPGGVPVTIEEGTLRIDGSLTDVSELTVGPLGTLAGTGDGVSTGILQGPTTVRGRVAPSTTAGRLYIQNDATFEAGSVLESDIQPGGGGDELHVLGTATLVPGARLQIQAQPSDFSGPINVPVLSAATGISGAFQVNDFAFLDETVSLNMAGTELSVTLAPNSLTFSDFATTPNQLSVAQTLEALQLAGPTGDLADVMTALDRATSAELPGVLDAIGGEPLVSFATARQMLGERTSRALHRRVRDLSWGQKEAIYAASAELPLPRIGGRGSPLGYRATPPLALGPAAASEPAGPASRSTGGVWAEGYAQYGKLDGRWGRADLDAAIFGGTLGADAWIDDHVVLGLAAGYAHGDLDLSHRASDLSADTIQGALYAGYADPRGFAAGYARYAYTFQDSSRHIDSSQFARTARADWVAQDYGAGAEAGVTILRHGSLGVQPLVGFDWLRLTEESYREKGAGSLSLEVDPKDLDSLTLRVGGRLVTRAETEGSSLLVPELRFFWQREFGDRDRLLYARLSGAPVGGGIGVRGVEIPRDIVILGVGWSASVSPILQVLADYDALIDSDLIEHQGTLALRLRF